MDSKQETRTEKTGTTWQTAGKGQWTMDERQKMIEDRDLTCTIGQPLVLV